MSEKKPPLDFGLEDLDWDAAIAEWEQSTLVPEVIHDGRKAPPRPTAIAKAPPAAGAPPPPAPPADRAPVTTRPPPAPPLLEPIADVGARVSPVPRPPRAGLDQLFKSKPPEPPPTLSKADADLAELLDREVGETTRRTSAPPPLSGVPSPIDRDSEEALSATLVQRDANAIAPTSTEDTVTADRDLFEGLAREPGDEDEPTKHIKRASIPRPDAAGPPSSAVDPAAPRPARARPPSERPPSDLSSTVEASSLRAAHEAQESTATRPFVPRAHDDDAPTRLRHRSNFPSLRPPEEPEGDPPEAVTFEGEAPGPEQIDDDNKAALVERAEWFEAEAREMSDALLGARTLLVASELYAMCGQADAALRLAVEAREIDPRLPLAHWQARTLTPREDTQALVAALDAEARDAATPAHRLHAVLVAGEHLRAAGDDAEAAARWDHAASIAPEDARATTARAIRALAKMDYTHPGLRFAVNPQIAPISLGVGTVLRLRGIERPDGDAGEILANDSLRRARLALEHGDVATAATLIAELRSVPELARGATWLAAALGATREETRAMAGQWLRRLVGPDDALARRTLAAIGVEVGDASLVDHAMSGDESFAPYERAALAALMRLPLPQSEAELAAIAAGDGMQPLAAAVAAITFPASAAEARTRARRSAGREASRKLVTLGRLLGTDAPDEDVDAALRDAQGEDGAKAIALELAVRSRRYDEVSARLAAWSEGGDAEAARDRQLAAALVAERAGQREHAVDSYKAARAADAACEPAVRALLELEQADDADIALADLADAVKDPLRGALLRLEAIARAPDLADADVAGALEHVYKAAPELPFAPFLAERVARRAGNVDEVLRWIRERRASVTDPLEGALDAVREALLVADTEPELAAERMADAHQARPEDVALRELYERLAVEPVGDRAAWRERRAATAIGPSKALLYTEAAYEYERLGDEAACLRAAQAAREAGDEGLGRLALERAEVEGGSAARLADELLTLARSTENARERREAYERLAELDAIGRNDPASALLWHRAILEFEPLYKTSLRYVEHTFVSEGRQEELEAIAASIAKALDRAGGECAAHAELAARLRLRLEMGWETTRDMAELAAAQPEPPLWALRLADAHARAAKDDARLVATSLALAGRTTRSFELSALHLRAAEAAMRTGDIERARELLERAANEDPGDVVTWGQLADVRQRCGDVRGAAEAGEALARTSSVAQHQLLAWYDSARIWADDAGDLDRALPCLEQAAAIDVSYEDVFPRLSALYAQKGAREELAALLEKRIATVSSPEERVELEVERGRALADVGDHDGARAVLKEALAAKPDHLGALAVYGDLCAAAHDWETAEQAWVRLARSLTAADEQRDVYKKLGELYAVHAVNLSRAEVAFKEVLKRAPNDVETLERLVTLYARQTDAPRAIEVQQQLIALAADDAALRRARVVGLAGLYDDVARDARRAEQTLESARREAPGDVAILRALAEFYQKHKQGPAVNILLDRASGDARRALAAGRFTPASFEMMQTVFDLRGRKDAARVVGATLAAFEGRPSSLRGAETRAADPRLDDLLAPELLTPALRALLARAGDALDAASPLDLRALRAAQLPASAAQLQGAIATLGQQMGIGVPQVLVSSQLGRTCVPCSSAPAMIVLGDGLLSLGDDPASTFLVMRALKLVQARASALVRTPAKDMAVLLAGWLRLFNPQWQPEGFNAAAVNEASRRLHAGLPRQLPPDVGVIALEVAGSVGGHGAMLGAAAMAWANRMALLAVGDPSAAFDAIAWSSGLKDGAPADPQERASWATRTVEVKDLIAFSVSDPYAEARARLALDK